jgi:hypothetical protein
MAATEALMVAGSDNWRGDGEVISALMIYSFGLLTGEALFEAAPLNLLFQTGTSVSDPQGQTLAC